MRRKRALKRGRWLSLLAAGLVGYVAGNWHAIALRTVELTASQNIALRFPEADADSVPSDAAPQAPVRATNAIILGDTSSALLSPAPMIASAVRQAPAASAQPGATPQALPVRVAAADAASAANPVFGPRMPVAAVVPVLADTKADAKVEPKSDARIESKVEPKSQPQIALKPDINVEANPDAKSDAKVASIARKLDAKNAAGDSTRNPAKRTYVLNDAQIAQIKSRLHLSPDQEQMWPAVEAALRTIAYSRSRGHRGGATSAEVAALDPYGPEVQGLKSAAFPLVMSFSDDQRSEVRSIVHVMGLDQLASQL
jgi:hypothetical protein